VSLNPTKQSELELKLSNKESILKDKKLQKEDLIFIN